MTDTHNGWTNRETWSANLMLSNDEHTYRYVVRELQKHLGQDSTDKEIVELFEGFGAMFSDKARNEVGDLNNVSWLEIGQHWVEDEL